jgi:hypothetical protein
MSLLTALRGDWRNDEDVGTVTYTSPASVVFATVKAKRRGLTYKEVAMAGAAAVQSTDCVWEVWAETLQTAGVDVEPEDRGTITASDGGVWQILSKTVRTFKDVAVVYHCAARKQA